ncbi:hypothetical protein ABZW30_38120, partial [Kitasatospora sp. NPDC004669]|uniref:hypothetical protein n=1 Tax=Kitasatospora sp. NPDC004669 TaxID=3154555 RepID=UPI0033A6BF8B
AVEFSRNGHFLRTAFQRALRALRSFVFPAYQIFSAIFTGFVFSEFPLAGFPSNFAPKLIKAFGVLSPQDLLRRRARIS